MKYKQHFSKCTLKLLLLLLLFSFTAVTAFAQCPSAASCTPGAAPAANHIFGMGIFEFSLGAITNTTAGVTDGYQDYSCSLSTSLTAGNNHAVSVRTGPNANENVLLWIDYNNDGYFSSTELAFTSSNKKQHSGTIAVPATAVLNTPLRLRLSADAFSAPLPTACSTPQYSQVEDYAVTITSNSQPPVAAFSFDSLTCSGSVSFSDNSTGGVSSWLWSFGDGTTSPLQNPVHNYAAPGTYPVSLVVTNANGSDTVSHTVVYRTGSQPIPAVCVPNTTNYCCGYGIFNFSFAGKSNRTTGGSAGYEDFTCPISFSVQPGISYPFTVETGTGNPQDTRIFIDFNNDGSFSASEKVFQQLNGYNPTGSISIPASGVVLNTPLRLRVISDNVGGAATGCSLPDRGQAEDYTIVINSGTAQPVARISSDNTELCRSTISFTDQSLNSPTSWSWDFGDGQSSNSQNPSHSYSATGTYAVQLTACNSAGCNTTYTYVYIKNPCPQYCDPTYTGPPIYQKWMERMQLNTIDNSTGPETQGYGIYRHLYTVLKPDSSYTLTGTYSDYGFNCLYAWIDYNRDGVFDATERLAANLSIKVNSFTFTVPKNILYGPTLLRVMQNTTPCNAFSACYPLVGVRDIEDYTVIILPHLLPPLSTKEAIQEPEFVLYPNPSQGLVHLFLQQQAAVSVYNLVGQQVLKPVQADTEELTLDLQHLPKGLYLVRVETRQGVKVKRLVLE